jgi:hypothetical protein
MVLDTGKAWGKVKVTVVAFKLTLIYKYKYEYKDDKSVRQSISNEYNE